MQTDRLRAYFAMDRGRGNIAALDGLRGIAILLVLGRHALRPFYSESEGFVQIGGWELGAPLINGWMGVDLFFVLSGFLITHQFIRRRGRGGGFSLGDYLTRRVFRIVPTYYVVLLIVVAGLIPAYSPEASTLDVVKHLLFLQDYSGSKIVPAFWSLGVEEKFYLAAPFLFAGLFLLRRTSWRVGILLGLMALPLTLRIATFLSHPEIDTYNAAFPVFRSPFHLNLDGFFVGIALAFLYAATQDGRLRVSERWASTSFRLGLAVIVGLLFLQPLADQPTWFNATLLPSLLASAFGAIMFGLLYRQNQGAGLFGSGGLFVIAKISYPLYLIHMPLIPVTYLILDRTLGLGGMSALTAFAVFLPAYFVASMTAATWLHYGVEKPCLALRDRLRAPRKPADIPERESRAAA